MEKGFLLDEFGDVMIQNGEIQMVSGDALMRQTLKSILSTNKGEWFLNEEEGIQFRSILVKNPLEEEIKNEIFGGLLQIDDTFIMDSFDMDLHADTRLLTVHFTASNADGHTIQSDNSWEM